MIGRRLFTSLVLVLGLVGLWSCGPTDGPTAPDAPDPSLLLGNNGGLLGTGVGSGLLGCTPLPYARTEQTVGPAGGTILVGPHRLVIPAGALASPVLITAEAPSDSVNSVRLLPHGLDFAAGPGRYARAGGTGAGLCHRAGHPVRRAHRSTRPTGRPQPRGRRGAGGRARRGGRTGGRRRLLPGCTPIRRRVS